MINLPIILSYFATFMALAMMFYSVKYRNAEKSYFFILLSFQAFLYTFGYLLELQSENLFEALYSVRIQYMTFPFILPSCYLFLRDTFGKKKLSMIQAGALFLVPMVTLIAMQSYPHTHVFYTEVAYISNRIFANALISPGPWYHVHSIYSYLIIVCIFGLLFEVYFGENQLKRKQSIPLMIGFSAPVAASMAYLLFKQEVFYDFTPIATAFSTATLIYCANYQDLLQVVPLAKNQLISSMEDAFIVFDREFCFIDANASAKIILPQLAELVPGDEMSMIWDFYEQEQVTLTVKDQERIFEITPPQQVEQLRNGAVYVVLHDVTEKEELLKELHKQAMYDYLTDVYNRRAFFKKAEERIIATQNQNDRVVMLLDIDNFKEINDRYGHPCGDTILKRLCEEIRNNRQILIPDTVFGRYGGEEFAFLFTSLSHEQAIAFADSFRKRISEMQISWQNHLIHLTISVGVSYAETGEQQTLEELLLQSDIALYQAKQAGKNKVCLYNNIQNIHGFSDAK